MTKNPVPQFYVGLCVVASYSKRFDSLSPTAYLTLDAGSQRVYNGFSNAEKHEMYKVYYHNRKANKTNVEICETSDILDSFLYILELTGEIMHKIEKI